MKKAFSVSAFFIKKTRFRPTNIDLRSWRLSELSGEPICLKERKNFINLRRKGGKTLEIFKKICYN